MAQFLLAEEAVAALGVVVWPIVAFEAEYVLAAAAMCFRSVAGVDQVVLGSPDKDFAQVVSVNTRSPFCEAAMGNIPSLARDVSHWPAGHGILSLY